MSKTEIPSIRFRGFDDAWEQRKLGDIIIEYKETVDSDCTLPILTSSKTEGVILQEEHFGRKQQHIIASRIPCRGTSKKRSSCIPVIDLLAYLPTSWNTTSKK